MRIRLQALAAAGLAILGLLAGASARAQAPAGYPSKPIRMIVPFAAGGTTDVVARLVAQRMQESMGQPVLVENRAGAGGAIGADAVAKAAPDGYTIMMHNLTFPLSSVAQVLSRRSPFNPDTDFAGVSIAVYVPFVLTAYPGVPAKDLRELATLLRSRPELQYNFGSTGPGSTVHVLGEAFKREAKVNMEHVGFRGAAPLKQEMLAGRIQIGGDQLSTSLAEIKAGTLKALATTASKRIAVLPDVPTVRELGFAGLELEGWNGVFAPARTPKDVLDRLQREVVAAVRHPDVARRLVEMGAEPVGSTGAEQDAIFRRQMDQFRPIIQDMKLE
ncbi:MAG TPA: tripartite tricarboxylate transporter substrate-binding protein [Ramlibacter sp.]|jgi:tripartite-type tricarboxylate transporter receptor subunit TctC|uniref:Bug family tripartite tricarboxylate transporter substrate binding protein n=1 Tax=Ramlibacter sp. TaxID=1917967 RepID=UPI002D5006CF|nr:tripartite tricarboxylate transporter substrate-binding protein [Ramlibacter sp.]HZY16907.1 tripartite tricarboxylate transporter substrate-binding protein [Ramlibacter sp.]